MLKKKYYMVNIVTKEIRVFQNFKKLWKSYSKQSDKKNIRAVKGKEIKSVNLERFKRSYTWIN